MKKMILFALLCTASIAFGREVTAELKIVKGPYFVKTENSVYNVLGPDFKAKAISLVFMTPNAINVEFPRHGFFSVKAIADGSYFYGNSQSGKTGVRVGFEGNQLSWFYTRGEGWDVSIVKSDRRPLVSPTSFAKMDADQLLSFARIVADSTDMGSIEDAVIVRQNGVTVLTANVLQMEEDGDEPSIVGTAKFTFTDTDGARLIKLQASVTDLE